MHKNVQTNPEKSQKLTQHSCCSMLTREKKLEAIRGNGYRFIPKGGTFPTETIMLVVRSSSLWEAYPQTCPKWDKNFTTACWCRSMIACQVLWISDEFWIYYNLKTRHLNVLKAINGALVFEIHSHFLHGTSACNQGHTFEFSTNLYALEHVHVVQIWIMHMNALKT